MGSQTLDRAAWWHARSPVWHCALWRKSWQFKASSSLAGIVVMIITGGVIMINVTVSIIISTIHFPKRSLPASLPRVFRGKGDLTIHFLNPRSSGGTVTNSSSRWVFLLLTRGRPHARTPRQSPASPRPAQGVPGQGRARGLETPTHTHIKQVPTPRAALNRRSLSAVLCHHSGAPGRCHVGAPETLVRAPAGPLPSSGLPLPGPVSFPL